MLKNMKEIVALDVLSVAKVQAIITFVMGFLVSILTLILTLIQTSVGFPEIVSLIVLPFIYALIGFVGGVIGSFVYNKFAHKFGGVKVSLK